MGYELPHGDLIRVEGKQPRSFMDRFYAVSTVPLAEAVKSPDLFGAFVSGARRSGLRVEAGQQVTLCRFTDESRDRLAEMVELVIVEAYPHAVDFRVLGSIVQMPAAPEGVDDLIVAEIPGEFRAVAGEPDANENVWWRVETRNKGLRGQPWVMVQHQMTEAAAEQHAEWQRKASPDFVVRDKAGNDLSSRFSQRHEAEAFRTQEIGRRKMAVTARVDARKPKIHAVL